MDDSQQSIQAPAPVAPLPDQRKALRKPLPPQRHYLAAFFLSFTWGMFGVDRFYLGKVGTGIVKLLTFGGVGLWATIDLVVIMSGTMKDKQGRLLLQADTYKKFSQRVVMWFSIILGVVIIIGGLILIGSLYYIVSGVLDGSLKFTLPGIPGINGLTGQSSELDALGL